MNKDDPNFTGNKTLRQKAEKIYHTNHTGRRSARSETEALNLVHELEVYQIELEMQYQELLI